MRGFARFRPFLWVAAFVLPVATGCSMSWTEGWKVDREAPLKGTPDVDALRQAARAADAKAVDRPGVEAMARAWKDVLRAVPDDYEALTNLASTYTLLGAGYPRSVGEKGEFYRKALQYAERAMALDEGFKAAVENGTRTWDAIPVLPASRAEAVGWWATALMRRYHECLSGVVQETRKEWIAREEGALAHLASLDPAWNGNLALYDRAVTAAAMPKRAGGDLGKAAEMFDQAVAASPEWLRNRFGRAAFLATARKDRDAFRADLDWVVAQDAKAAPGPFGWNVLIQRDAAAMIARESDWF